MHGILTAGAAPEPPARALQAALAAWYADHGRRLAFRATTEPWPVLVSEVMAQQTQVSRVEPAWRAFLGSFPRPADLAAASPGDVLRAWAGMGYNRRALALRRAAMEIVERHGGAVPATIEALERLPGIGPYTARAVAAIAFGVPVAAVDTNIRRVVRRLVAGTDSTAADRPTLAAREIQRLADDLVDPADPGRWTHAMMDLGATVCRPRGPRCDACPLVTWCSAARSGAVAAADGVSVPSGPPARPVVPFPATRRWLRGRIIAELRVAPRATWTSLAGPIGIHDPDAVATAIADLVREGFVEQRPDGALRLPSA